MKNAVYVGGGYKVDVSTAYCRTCITPYVGLYIIHLNQLIYYIPVIYIYIYISGLE